MGRKEPHFDEDPTIPSPLDTALYMHIDMSLSFKGYTP